jgi:hypothetical protein
VSFSTSSVINSVSVTSLKIVSTGETWSYNLGPYVDQNSIDKYGAYAASFTVHGMSDAAVATWAGQVLAANAVPVRKVNSITVPVVDSFGVDHALAVDLCSPVGVTRSGIVAGTLRVESITHTIQANADFDRWLVGYEFADPGTVATPQQVRTENVQQNVVPDDTGWLSLPLSGFTGTAQGRRDGNQVQIRWNLSTSIAAGALATPVAAGGIPATLRPSGHNVPASLFGSGAVPMCGEVGVDGAIVVRNNHTAAVPTHRGSAFYLID